MTFTTHSPSRAPMRWVFLSLVLLASVVVLTLFQGLDVPR